VNTISRVIFLSVIVIVAFAGYWITSPKRVVVPDQLQGILSPVEKMLSDFNLIDQYEKPFTLERLKNKWSFVFFGYTHCPDICPTSMQDLKVVIKQLKEKYPDLHKNTQVVFVSVDPKRDTAKLLGEYVSYFNKDFIALTGVKKQIDNFTFQVGAGYFIEPPTNEAGDYPVAHTGSFFLVGPKGDVHAQFPQPHDTDKIVSQYNMIRKLSNSKQSILSFN